MQEEEDWSNDPDFVEAIEENFSIMLRFSEEMKEWIVQIFALNYKPDNEKMEQLLSAERVQERENSIIQQKEEFMIKTGRGKLEKQEEAGEEDGEEVNKVAVEVDEGVYLWSWVWTSGDLQLTNDFYIWIVFTKRVLFADCIFQIFKIYSATMNDIDTNFYRGNQANDTRVKRSKQQAP